MNYSSDKPIESIEQDLLGRSLFSKQLGKAIYSFDGQDGLVIGLFGKWGTGKTSVINMALNEIKTLAKDEEDKPLIMKFAPWNYSDKDNLISLFFQGLKNEIDIQGNDDFKKKVGKVLSDYSGALDALALVPIVGSGLAAILKPLVKACGDNLMQVANLDETKKKLEEALIETGKKIVVVVDDIDRLTNSQIRDIFQLVKQVADFPNIIYVLSMDREVVRSALSEVHNINGNEYLEKIIQVSFELPELRKSKLHQIFFDKLNNIIRNLPINITLDQRYWNNVFHNCIEPYLNTLRDINRVINTFQFSYGALYQETAFEDMIAITTLEVMQPELYSWLSQNKDAVCGGFLHGIGSKTNYCQLYTDEFIKMGVDPKIAIPCIATLFPVFAKDVNESQYAYWTETDIRSKMRVAHEGRFGLYFMFSMEDVKVSRRDINLCIYELDRDALHSAIRLVNEQGNISYLLRELRSLVGEIPYQRLSLLASVLLKLQGEFYDDDTSFLPSTSEVAGYLAADIIAKLETEGEKYEVLRSAVGNANESNLGSIAQLINRIELSYGRLAGKDVQKPGQQIISLTHLQELEQLYLQKVSETIDSVSIWNINNFYFVSYLWSCFDKKNFLEYITPLLANDLYKLKYICAMAYKWHGSNGNGWSFQEKEYSQFVSNNDIYNSIQTFGRKNLPLFTDIEQIKLATFYLLYNRKDDSFSINESEARAVVQEWLNA